MESDEAIRRGSFLGTGIESPRTGTVVQAENITQQMRLSHRVVRLHDSSSAGESLGFRNEAILYPGKPSRIETFVKRIRQIRSRNGR